MHLHVGVLTASLSLLGSLTITRSQSSTLSQCPHQIYESVCSLGGSFTLRTPASVSFATVCDRTVTRAQIAAPPLIQYEQAKEVRIFHFLKQKK
jgi:hypothetical protein